MNYKYWRRILQRVCVVVSIGMASTGAALLSHAQAAACDATLQHYNAISIGMPEAQVIEIVSCGGDITAATESATATSKTLEWQHSSGAAYLSVYFENGRVSQKAQFGLK